ARRRAVVRLVRDLHSRLCFLNYSDPLRPLRRRATLPAAHRRNAMGPHDLRVLPLPRPGPAYPPHSRLSREERVARRVPYPYRAGERCIAIYLGEIGGET